MAFAMVALVRGASVAPAASPAWASLSMKRDHPRIKAAFVERSDLKLTEIQVGNVSKVWCN